MERLSNWARGLPERHGRKTLVLLALILALGFGLRAYRVVEPLASPGDDAHAYYDLSKSLYEEGTYGSPEFDDASDWSPGAPLLYAASFYATGGPREGTARIVELLLGLATIVVVYLLGRRVWSAPAGLIAALGVAVYPPFIHSTGALYSEPPAMLTLPLAILLFLKAQPPLLSLGEAEMDRAAAASGGGLAVPRCRVLLRPDGADPTRVPRSSRSRSSRSWRIASGGRGLAAGAEACGSCGSRGRDRGPDHPLDGPQHRHPRPGRPDQHRGRQGSLRRHPAARRRRIPAGQGAAGEAIPRPRPRTGLRSARQRRTDTALRPRRRTLSRPSARPGPRQDRQGKLPRLHRRRPERVRGDDGSQGLADVERRRRRSDERDRRAGRSRC